MALTKPENAVVDNPVQAAMAAIAAGQDPDSVVYKGESIDSEPVESEPEEKLDEQNSISEQEQEAPQDSETEGESESEIESVAPKSSTKSTPTSAIDFEEVFVKSADGKRQAIKIDYSNKDSIKQAYLKAAGFPVLNNKLSVLTKKHSGLEKEHLALKADMDKLEDIYQNQGVEALIRQLGKGDELEKLVDAKIKHREYLASLSPEEKYRLEMKQQTEVAEKKASEVEAKYKKMMEDIEAKEEAAAMRSMESRLHPAFDKYRFSGKLGDEAMEHDLDETIWNKVTKKLQEYPEDVELTQAVIDREFRTAYQNLSKVIQVQAEKKVVNTVDKKKAEAAKTAQLIAKKGVSTSGDKEQFMESIKSGNLMGAFAALSGGKVKL